MWVIKFELCIKFIYWLICGFYLKININSIIWLERKENEIVVGFLNKSFLM